MVKLVSLAASRSFIVGSNSSGMVGRGECNIGRKRCAGSGARARRIRGVTRMGLGLI